MRRSHLERYLDIINLLARYGPQKQTHIMYHTNVNNMVLKEDLRFLIKQALIEEQTTKTKRVVFRATQTRSQSDKILPKPQTNLTNH